MHYVLLAKIRSKACYDMLSTLSGYKMEKHQTTQEGGEGV